MQPRQAPSLLESLQGLIERTYRMETGVRDIGRYIIGDEGYRRFYGESGSYGEPRGSVARAGAGLRRSGRHRPCVRSSRRVVGAAQRGASAKVLVHDVPGAVAAHIYYPDDLIRRLEADPPTRGLGDRNVDAFATFVEELDHFLLVAERARLARPVSLLELEIHANVTKYLVCALFLAAGRARGRRPRADVRDRVWIRWHLFEKIEYSEPDREVQVRYRDASRFARRFIDRLDGEPHSSARLALLRGFHDASHQEKLAALA